MSESSVRETDVNREENVVPTHTHSHTRTQEQVDMTIKDATNVEKLCEMYEGWTPWV